MFYLDSGEDALASGNFSFSLLQKGKPYKLSFNIKLKSPEPGSYYQVNLGVSTTQNPTPIPQIVQIDNSGNWQDAETAIFVASDYGSVYFTMVNISGKNIELLIDAVKFVQA